MRKIALSPPKLVEVQEWTPTYHGWLKEFQNFENIQKKLMSLTEDAAKVTGIPCVMDEAAEEILDAWNHYMPN